MRRATTRKATLVRGPHGMEHGYEVDLTSISIAEENIFYNYEDGEAAHITFLLSNHNTLTLYFPRDGSCLLVPNAQGKQFFSPSSFQRHFNCPIAFVPILGPVEHHELLYEKEAARLALFSYRAARNFRNIWYHYPSKFDAFRSVLQQTWPGMDIERPEIDRSHQKPVLHMYCPEDRIPRELFWSGFGFQVWCQMLTHLIQSKDVSIFLIDEPDIYLHSELQRQLLGLLRDLGPDILLATHSTEIITESETNDIVLVNKARQSARRIKDPAQLEQAFRILGSSLNPVLTQLAKTRRVLFVEGKDFQILSKFARKLNVTSVGQQRNFAVVPVEGFNPERIRSLKAGMETTLGGKVVAAAVLDRDYRCDAECAAIAKCCEEFCQYVSIHNRKEIENFLLVPSAISRAVALRVSDRARRSGIPGRHVLDVDAVLNDFCQSNRPYVTSQILDARRRFEHPKLGQHVAKVDEATLNHIEILWRDPQARLRVVPGKGALTALNQYVQDAYQVSVTPTAIIDAMHIDEIPEEMSNLIEMLGKFSMSSPLS